ncbi:unnamed protein product, partial [Ectocarpus sp. 12 AP-2014]
MKSLAERPQDRPAPKIQPSQLNTIVGVREPDPTRGWVEDACLGRVAMNEAVSRLPGGPSANHSKPCGIYRRPHHQQQR